MKVISINGYRHKHYRKPREPGAAIITLPGRKQETEEERIERIWQNILTEIRRLKREGENNDALTLDECAEIHRRMVAAIGERDEDADDIYRELLDKALVYTTIRFHWAKQDIHERALADKDRTGKHDSLLTSFKMLYRLCAADGKDTSWYAMLGDVEKNPAMRKRYGDFAAYLCFIEAINQR